MPTKRQIILALPLVFATGAAICFSVLALGALILGLVLGVQVTPTAAGKVLTIPTATSALSPGDWILRSPIDQPEELHEAQIARVSQDPAAVWIARTSENGQSVELPVRGEEFLKPIAKLPGWMAGS